MKKFISLLLIIFLGCARVSIESETSGTSRGAVPSALVTREAEVGRQIHEAIVSSFRVYTEPRLVGYVIGVGEALARVAERRDLPYQFTVLYDDRIYATGAPGGFIYITTGFLNFLENEAELAAVLAHEIGELQYRDPRFSFARQGVGALAQVLAAAAPFFGQIGVLAAGGVILLHALVESTIPTSEKRLEEADRRALWYLVEAGFDPQGYLDLLSRFLNLNPAWAPYSYDYLTSRPVTLERYQAVIEEFKKLPLEGKSFSVNREHFLEMTKGVREIYS